MSKNPDRDHTMNDDRREAVEAGARAAALREDWPWECLTDYSREHYRALAAAVLAALPSEGWEQVGWYSGKFAYMDDPDDEYEGWDAVYRRVDGAAPPKPERCGSQAVEGPCVLPAKHNMGRADIPENHIAASSTPTETERLREALERIAAHQERAYTESTMAVVYRQAEAYHDVKAIARAALSGQQDTTTERDCPGCNGQGVHTHPVPVEGPVRAE